MSTNDAKVDNQFLPNEPLKKKIITKKRLLVIILVLFLVFIFWPQRAIFRMCDDYDRCPSKGIECLGVVSSYFGKVKHVTLAPPPMLCFGFVLENHSLKGDKKIGFLFKSADFIKMNLNFKTFWLNIKEIFGIEVKETNREVNAKKDVFGESFSKDYYLKLGNSYFSDGKNICHCTVYVSKVCFLVDVADLESFKVLGRGMVGSLDTSYWWADFAMDKNNYYRDDQIIDKKDLPGKFLKN
jgi:hypothetical protein